MQQEICDETKDDHDVMFFLLESINKRKSEPISRDHLDRVRDTIYVSAMKIPEVYKGPSCRYWSHLESSYAGQRVFINRTAEEKT